MPSARAHLESGGRRPARNGCDRRHPSRNIGIVCASSGRPLRRGIDIVGASSGRHGRTHPGAGPQPQLSRAVGPGVPPAGQEDGLPEGRRALREAFKRLERELPAWGGRGLRRLRHPHARWLRIPIGLLAIVGGVFSFLPVLGIWMLPLGLLLIASDVPVLRRPVARFTIWMLERWTGLRAWRGARRSRPGEGSTPTTPTQLPAPPRR